MRRELTISAAALAAMTFTTLPAIAEGLNVTIDGVRNAEGSVLVLVFDDAGAFDRLDWRAAADYADIPAQTGHVSHSFPDLTTGPYALFVFHDENGDQDLNVSGERLLEGVGASGVTASTPEPSFEEAAVNPGDVTVRLYYDQ